MAFELWTDGITLIDRVARLFNKHSIARDPLSGVVDGQNRVFYVNYPPILSSGSLAVYAGGNTAVSSSLYTVDYDGGCIVLTPAPQAQPSASYTTTKYSNWIIKSILVAGFDEMEGWWYRGYALTDTLGTVNPITEDSTAAYVVDSTGSDPTVAAVTFSTSRTQLNLFTKCTQLAFYRTLMGEHALSDFIWKESQGAQIDKSMTVKNLRQAYDVTLDALKKALEPAQYEVLGDSAWGGAVTGPMTREFISHRYWQKASIAEQWRTTTPYRGNMW